MSLVFDDLRKVNVERRNAHPDSTLSKDVSFLAMAMAGECGEACNEIKKYLRDEKKKTERVQNIAHELADLIIYADLVAHALAIDLGEAVREKFNIVSDRYDLPQKL